MSNIAIWNEPKHVEEIKKIFAPNLNNLEFQTFVELGKFTGLNPFLKEMWAVKFGSNAAQIFIGRDGYRKSAQRHAQYDYHYVEAVYSNDFFESNEGVYHHKFNLKDRGTLVGAYCNVKRKDSSRPLSLFVEFKEYNLGQSLWKTKPATMIKKVAEAQGLRMAFQELFSGTYDESEEWNTNIPSRTNEINRNSTIQIKQAPQLASSSDQYLSEEHPITNIEEKSEFGETAQDKRYIFRIASEIALAFDFDPQKDDEIIKTICRNVLDKKPTIDNLEEQINKTFFEYIKSKENENK